MSYFENYVLEEKSQLKNCDKINTRRNENFRKNKRITC